MTASANDLADVRRMINEPTITPYTDAIINRFIERYPCLDTAGLESGDAGWVVCYDLHAAAADLWAEKAALVQTYYDFSADGGRYTQSQLYENAMDQSRYHAARRKPSSRYSHKSPVETGTGYRGLIYDPIYAWWRV